MVQTDSRTPRQQAQWVNALLAHSGRYGVVTHLSQTIGVACQTLYRWVATPGARTVVGDDDQ